MSPHVQDRLSAFRDRELPPDQVAEVEGHLRSCEVCSRHLEELALVDEAAADLAIEVPEGYFETFPSRVREKLRRSKPRVLRPAFYLPIAAVLAMATLVPFFTRRMAETPSAVPAQEPYRQEAPTSAAMEEKPPTAETETKKKAAPPPPAEREAPAPGRLRSLGYVAQAPAPPPRPADAPPQNSAGKDLAQPVPAAPPPAASQALRADASDKKEAETSAGASRSQAETVIVTAEDRVVDGHAAAEAQKPRAKTAFASPPQAKSGEPGVVTSPSATEGALVQERLSAGRDEASFQELRRRKAGSVEEARELRESWRRYLAANEESPQADDVRVQLIRAGVDAYRRSQDPQDLSVLRKDAAAYLARSDARQADRVRGLLRSAAPTP